MREEANREAIRAAAALMGSRRSERKTIAARENGRLGGPLGGRPKLFAPCLSGKPHRWQKGRCRFCGLTKSVVKIVREENHV